MENRKLKKKGKKGRFHHRFSQPLILQFMNPTLMLRWLCMQVDFCFQWRRPGKRWISLFFFKSYQMVHAPQSPHFLELERVPGSHDLPYNTGCLQGKLIRLTIRSSLPTPGFPHPFLSLAHSVPWVYTTSNSFATIIEMAFLLKITIFWSYLWLITSKGRMKIDHDNAHE